MSRPAALALAGLLAACAPFDQGPAARGLMPDAGGLQPLGSAQRIDFGRDEPGVVAAVSALMGVGPIEIAHNPPCDPGLNPVIWSGGLVLLFRDGAFVGWTAAAPVVPASSAWPHVLAGGVPCRA